MGTRMSAILEKNNALTKNLNDITSGMTLATKVARGTTMNNMLSTKVSDTIASGK